MKIRDKLYSAYFIGIIIPILLVSIYMVSAINTTITENDLKDTELSFVKTNIETSKLFDQAITISNLINEDEDLVKLVSDHYESPYEMYLGYQKYPVFTEYFRYYIEIEDIRFFVDNESMYTNSKILINNKEAKATEWYARALSSDKVYFWDYVTDPLTRKTHLSLIRTIKRGDTQIGVLVLYLDEEYISKTLLRDNMDHYLILNNDTVIMSNDTTEFEELDEINRVLEEIQTNDFPHKINEKGTTFFVGNLQTMQSSPTSILQITRNSNDLIKSNIQSIMSKGYLIIGLVLLLSFVFIAFSIRIFDSRVKKLNQSMTKVSKGDFNIPPKISGKDEISELNENLYETMLSLKTLISNQFIYQIEEKEWKIKHQQSEFNRLRSQINPHFLYNSLEMIRMKSVMAGSLDVAEAIKILSKLLRKSLDETKEITTISEEIEFVELYLKIQKLRFGSRISYDINIQDQDLDLEIIPLIIQPLVENSFMHGIEKKIDNGHIQINIHSGEELIIEVVDDGVGMSRDTLESLQNNLNQESNMHIGLFNVQQRIKYFYGDEYGFTITSVEGVGTKVHIRLPRPEGALDGNIL